MGCGAQSLALSASKKMTFKTRHLMFLAVALALSTFEGLWAGSLEFGHVRARSRGWIDTEEGNIDGQHAEAEETTIESIEPLEEEMEITEEVVGPEDSPEDNWAELDEDPSGPKSEERLSIGKQVSSTVKATVDTAVRSGKRVWGLTKRNPKPNPKHGYLVMGGAPSVRFSDLDPVAARPPAPALPEFSYVASEYDPYLIETALPEDAKRDNSMLAEVVIDLEPHEIVSGKIDTRVKVQEERVEDFSLDEQRTSVLRPEEVLIFFETDTANSNSAKAIVPFSPAQPTTDTTIKSSATLKKN